MLCHNDFVPCTETSGIRSARDIDPIFYRTMATSLGAECVRCCFEIKTDNKLLRREE